MKSFVFIVTMKITTCVLLGLLTICFARPAEGKIHSSKFCIKNNCISIVILLQSCFKQLYLFIDNENDKFAIVETAIIFYVHILRQIYYLEF